MSTSSQPLTAVVPDSLWFNGQVQTLDPARPQATAFAVKEGRLLAVGGDADILALAGKGTRQHDLCAQFVMPGLIDSHVHGLWGAARELFEVYVGLSARLHVLMDAVAARCRTVPPGEWINGSGWHMPWLDGLGESPRQVLDRVAPEHPVVLRDATYHTAWLNSAALRRCGIDANTPDMVGGRIGRDGAGEPDGLLYEAAQGLVRRFVQPTAAQLAMAVDHMQSLLHGLGITGFKEALATEAELSAYTEADAARRLQLDVATHMVRRSMVSGAEPTPTATLLHWRERYRGPHVHTGFIKLFLDGVGPSRTAAFLEPYLPQPGCQPGAHDPDAMLLYSPQQLADEVSEFDRHGLVVKMHAVGDRAVRAGLDAIEATRQRNGMSGLRHEIGHTNFVHPDDLPRFKALGAVADMSPRMWFPNPMTASQYKVLGPVRTNRCHQIRSLQQAGAELVYGSDWPAAAPDANPWVGLAGMLSRRNPFGLFPGVLGESEAIPLAQALPLFCTQGARALGLEDQVGMLSKGKAANFIRLASPLAGQAPEEIARTQVLQTVFEGRVVHER